MDEPERVMEPEPVEAEAVPADVVEAEPREFDWLPDNFNDPADLVKSYQHAQSQLTRQFARASEAERRVAELEAQLAAFAEQPEDDFGDELLEDAFAPEQVRRSLSTRDLQAAMALKMAQVAPTPVTAEQALAEADQAMAASVPNWEQVRERVVAEVAQRPFLQPAVPSAQGWFGALEAGLKLVHAANVEQQVQRSAEMLSAKQHAQTMAGAGVRQPAMSPNEQWAREIAEANKTIGGL